MKFEVIIPQLFYDAIARLVPGAVFLLLTYAYWKMLISDIPSTSGDGTNAIESIGIGIVFVLIAYVFGWLLHGLAWSPHEPKNITREPDNPVQNKKSQQSDNNLAKKELSMRDRYQWIRLAHPEAGFRIVKLRAEARMLEGIRTAFLLSSLGGVILLSLYFLGWIKLSLWLTVALAFGSLGSAIIVYTRLEENAWSNYKGNIFRIYKLLHDLDNPIPYPETSMWPPK